jgi:Protein of unknown function (DUF2971)
MTSVFGLYYTRDDLPRVLEKYRSDSRSACPELLQHYTSTAGAVGILTTGRMWATNANYVNDAQELAYGMAIVTQVLRERTIGTTGPERSRGSLLQKRVEDMIADGSVYIACFCDAPDLLSQWRGYGGEAGIAIALDGATLCKLPTAILLPVEYDEQLQRQKVVEVVSAFESAVPASLIASDDPRASQELAKAAIDLALLVVSFKHHTFREEREWRMVPLEVPPVQFRVDGGWLRPYVEVDIRLPGVELPLVRGITVGPGRHARSTRNGVSVYRRPGAMG